MSSGGGVEAGRGRRHPPGQEAFRAIPPDDVDWKPFPAFPPEVRLAVLVGRPAEEGPYTIRVHVPHGVKLLPHRHPEDRIYTVISGVFFIGRGDRFDVDRLEAYPPGAVIVLPGGTAHFHWARSGDYVTQVTARWVPSGSNISTRGTIRVAPAPRPRAEPVSAPKSLGSFSTPGLGTPRQCVDTRTPR